MNIFSKIISGEIPAHVVAESVDFLAFLDISPLAEGHVLVIPKQEVDYIFDLDDETYTGLQLFAKIVATGLKNAIPCKKVGVAVIGLEVPGWWYEFRKAEIELYKRTIGSYSGEDKKGFEGIGYGFADMQMRECVNACLINILSSAHYFFIFPIPATLLVLSFTKVSQPE